MAADAEPAHPFDLVSVWLAALAWVADSRWRRLSGGTHTAALLDWVEGLDLRVVALRLAQPEDFGAGDSPGGWELCSTAEEVPRGLATSSHWYCRQPLLLGGITTLASSQSIVLLPTMQPAALTSCSAPPPSGCGRSSSTSLGWQRPLGPTALGRRRHFRRLEHWSHKPAAARSKSWAAGCGASWAARRRRAA